MVLRGSLRRRGCLGVSVVALVSFTSASSWSQVAPVKSEKPVTAQHAMVTSVQHDATDAGLEILHQGGNAVDAAVAVGFALAVVFPAAGNIGGGGFMLIRPGSSKMDGGKPTFLDYREKAPAAATADMYLDAKGNIIKGLSTSGPKASGVPGSVAGLALAEKKYGKLGLKKVMAPAIRLAREGYVLSEQEANYMKNSRNLPLFEESKRVYLRGGNLYKAGDRFMQPDLAKTLERIAENPDDFYKGAIAAQIADFEKKNGGLITAKDLADYTVAERTPLVGHYRGLEVLTSPPPSSGGIVLIESLNILEGYPLTHLGAGGAATGDRSVDQVHLITEAFRRSYLDRADFLGDPDYNPKMPLKEMANPAYAAAWRKTIDPVNATPSDKLVRPAGFMPEPPPMTEVHEGNETTHFSVVDSEGNAVASTYTLNFYFGNGMTVDGLGFVLNDEMDDFASKVGVPNGFGLIQGPANAIAPGKRPLSSMTPTMVSEPAKNGKPGRLRLVLGSPGGSTIITTVANDIISVVDNGLNVKAAADAPRFHHQWMPDVLQIEKLFPEDVAKTLGERGYTVKVSGAADVKSPGVWGASEMIAVDPKTGMLSGANDYRYPMGKAAGY